MKFSLASDLHLEFAPIELSNEEESDILILAGDIFVAKDFKIVTKVADRYREFLENVTGKYDHVVYVMGNHEHYNGDYAKTSDILKDEFKSYINLKFLNNTFVDICDVRFIGGTLWTDLNKMDPMTIQHLKGYMNDYCIVSNSDNQVSYKVNTETGGVKFKTKPSAFSPEDSYEEHKKFLAIIDEILSSYQDDKKIVVVGHHLPSYNSIPSMYKDQYHSNGGYASDLSEFILDRPRIKYWVHGHTHEECEYELGDTKIVCNPRGYYGYETRAYNFKVAQYEI